MVRGMPFRAPTSRSAGLYRRGWAKTRTKRPRAIRQGRCGPPQRVGHDRIGRDFGRCPGLAEQRQGDARFLDDPSAMVVKISRNCAGACSARGEVLISATGLPANSGPPTSQSSRFLSDPAMPRAYSGDEMISASRPADQHAQFRHRRWRRSLLVRVEGRQRRQPIVKHHRHVRRRQKRHRLEHRRVGRALP